LCPQTTHRSRHPSGEGLINLRADTPTGFQVTFKKKYADQGLASLPVEAGKDVDLEIKVTLPDDGAAGDYPVQITAESGNAQAEADLKVTVRGQPQLKLTGAADARNVSFRGSAPRNWEISFEPDSLDRIPAGESVEVVASVTPSSEAITGADKRKMGASSKSNRESKSTGKTSPPDAVISTEGLTKRYPNGTVAVDHLDLTIHPGEVYGMLGPNGSGKTTTILMLIGLAEATQGTVRVAGYDPLRRPLAGIAGVQEVQIESHRPGF